MFFSSGDAQCGKTKLVKAFKDLVVDEDAARSASRVFSPFLRSFDMRSCSTDYVVDYFYVNVKNAADDVDGKGPGPTFLQNQLVFCQM